eukprot:2625407-Amphidinium_carterae.1
MPAMGNRNMWWACASSKCRGWEWCRVHKCRYCGAAAPSWVPQDKPSAARGAAGDSGFMLVPKGRRAQRQARARSRNMEAERDKSVAQPEPAPQTPVQAASPTQETDASMDTCKNMAEVRVRFKHMLEAQKCLLASGPAAARAAVDQEVERLRSELRCREPLPQRLKSLQMGVERKTEKIEKNGAKLRELRQAQVSLQGQLELEIQNLRVSYAAKKKDLERQITAAEAHH